MQPGRPELLAASDETIDDAIRYADPLALRGVLYQLTGDDELLDIELKTLVVGGFREMRQVAKKVDVARIHEKAAAFLKAFRDAGAGPLPVGPAERRQQSMSLAVGGDVASSDLEMWLEELALDPWARGFSWSAEAPPAGVADFSVAVIGAGMGGLNAAVHLKRAGIPFTVLEKNSSVGGTWYENRYPGARVDSPSRIYTHIYGAQFSYPYPFCPQAENEKYFNWVADTFDVRGDIQFYTEVKSILWDDTVKQWEITAHQPDGPRTWRVNAVISAVGFLSRPNIPRLEGIDDFRGQWFHTARWPAGLDLTHKRVAVVGTGCTGYQLIPEIVDEADHVYVFQRTPNWVYEAPGYLAPYPDQVNWLDRNFPYLTNFARFQASFLNRPQNTLKGLQVDPDFHDEHAVSAINKQVRDLRMAFLQSKLGHRPDLLDKMTPEAPPMSARPVLVDRDYSVLDVLLRDDVSLVTEGIRRVNEDGIELPDGTRCQVDIIVLATGFKANDFLWPMDVRGRDGLPVEELWSKDGARAYVGSMLPGFPNFFMIYGPNTNQLSGLQIVAMEEVATRFALENIGALIEQDKQAVEVTEAAYWRYNAEIDRAERLMTYVDPRAHNYYQNQFGRSAANGPLDTRLVWKWLRDPAGRLPSDGQPGIDESLVEQYQAIDPRFGADLVVW
jgi:4-hydroxyacetophenone monooxygenase